ncbi:hypothetical protein RvY_06850-2 [Ramazzottius varieornatus]|nr:hypothetical protein RvY_06850-2 [Ramazzottius varieornatus]
MLHREPTLGRMEKPHFKIVSPGVIGFSTLASLSFLGPALEPGLNDLRRYDNSFTVSHTYLYNNNTLVDCDQVTSKVQDMLSKWYYQETAKDNQSTIIILTPGCTEGTMLNQLAAKWNVLLITTINSDIQIRFKAQSPTWVTTSIAPSVYQGYMCLGLLRFYNWTSAYVLVDEGARNYFTNTAKLTLQLMARQYFLHVTFTFNSRKSDFDFTEMLTKMARERRDCCKSAGDGKMATVCLLPISYFRTIFTETLPGSTTTMTTR